MDEVQPRPLGVNPLDRALQREMLLVMRAAYPDAVFSFSTDTNQFTAAEMANLAYLTEHGLCEVGINRDFGEVIFSGSPRITARGLDFLADDGGLTAILNVVTVRLHADTLHALLDAKVEASDLPPEKKSLLREHLRRLPGKALEAAANRLVKEGLDRLPDAAQWLERLVGLL